MEIKYWEENLRHWDLHNQNDDTNIVNVSSTLILQTDQNTGNLTFQ